MPTQTFTAGNDTYVVSSPGNYVLSFLGGDDRLTVNGGDFTTAHMDDGNDLVTLRNGGASVFGDAGNDQFDIYASNVSVDGGIGADILNIRGGSGQSILGGDDDDRFTFVAGALGITLGGGTGNDDFQGNAFVIGGTIAGGAGNDRFFGFGNRGGNIVHLQGGAGNDLYVVDVANAPTIEELVGEGTDSVQIGRGATYILPDNVENLKVVTLPGSTVASGQLIGNDADNAIIGHSGNSETLFGMGGNDTLNGNGGDDTVFGGDGDDRLQGRTGADILDGGIGNDVLSGGTGDDTMSGGDGGDVYYVDSLGDVVTESGATGTDVVRVSVDGYTLTAGIERGIIQNVGIGLALTGNGLDNVLTGSVGADTLDGSDGNDALRGAAGIDTLTGGSGNDSLDGGAGDDVMTGGAGDDTYYLDSTADSVVENVGEGTDTVRVRMGGYTLASNVENGVIIVGTGLALTGNELDNVLTGGNGSDTLDGLAGNDHLIGGAGNDELFAGTSISSGTKGDTLEGGAGNDILHGSDRTFILNNGNDVLDGGTGDDTMDGGSGNDAYYVDSLGDVVTDSGGFDGVWVSVDGYVLPADIEAGFVAVDTGLTLTGNSLANNLRGGGGGDVLTSGDGDDSLVGNAGNDTLNGEGGNDLLNGGDGDDTMYGGAGNDEFDPSPGNDVAYGGLGDDFYIVQTDEIAQIVENSGEGNDTVQIQISTYTLPDNVEVGALAIANGTMHGNAIANTLTGNVGNDLLDGDGGADSLSGLTGNDTFDYNSVSDSTLAAFDTIQDFTSGVDKIDVSTIDAKFNPFVKGNEAFTFVASGTGASGQLWVVADGANLFHVYADVDGGGADLRIDVHASSLSATDFVL